MTIKKIALRSLIAVVSIAALGLIFAYSKYETIPDLSDAVVVDTRTYDDRYAPVIDSVSDELNSFRESLTAPSISVAVAVGGKLVWAETRGFAKLEGERAATLDTSYAIGSVSKPITSALVMELWEDGVIDLDADVREYVAGFPEKAFPITLRQLLSHQAGVRHYGFLWQLPTFSEMSRNEQFDNIDASLELFQHDGLLFEPDTSFKYSTYGYTLISAAVEGATGRSFLELLNERITGPLGMQRTAADNADAQERATEYLKFASERSVLRTPETNSSYKWAGGGLVATPTDLARFGIAMLHKKLLNEDTTNLIFTARETADGELNPQHYGLGWRIGGIEYSKDETSEPEILRLFHHGGSSIGSATILLLMPDHDIVVAMAANSIGSGGSGPLTGKAAVIARQFLNFQVADQLASEIRPTP